MSIEESGRIVVRADRDLEDLIPTYLRNRRKDVVSMGAALARGDFERVGALGHDMKGTGGGYGFDRISELGSGLEQAGKGRDGKRIGELLESLSDYLERVEVIYE